mgnify:CR=1 FL=1
MSATTTGEDPTTVRGGIWHATLEYLANHESFRASDIDALADEHGMNRTRTWREMEALGWLRRDGDNSRVWHRGPQFEELTS